MICERCHQSLAQGEHGLYLCPLEAITGCTVIGDDIPGGVLIEHGLCHEDGTPQRFYTKSAIQAEAKRRGLVNMVRHRPDSKDGDKSAHTTRWI